MTSPIRSLITVDQLCPGDVFYTNDASIGGSALCLWTIEHEATINAGGGIRVDGRLIGYLTAGRLEQRVFRAAHEVVLL